MGVATLSVLGLVWVLIDKLTGGVQVPGWASIAFALFFFGGLQLFFLGVVGAYLARVYEEVKARPRYIVRDVWETDATARETDTDVKAEDPPRAATSTPETADA
jgi:hypothetical protein